MARGVLTEVPCSECKRMFIPARNHLYKISIKGKQHLYCSYTCYRKVQKEIEESRKKREDVI